jgi:hypothetical protein
MALSIDLTPAEIRREGWEALVSKLGVAKSLRFLLEYEKGHGNYTELRKELFAGRLTIYLRAWPKKESSRKGATLQEHRAEEIKQKRKRVLLRNLLVKYVK